MRRGRTSSWSLTCARYSLMMCFRKLVSSLRPCGVCFMVFSSRVNCQCLVCLCAACVVAFPQCIDCRCILRRTALQGQLRPSRHQHAHALHWLHLLALLHAHRGRIPLLHVVSAHVCALLPTLALWITSVTFAAAFPSTAFCVPSISSARHGGNACTCTEPDDEHWSLCAHVKSLYAYSGAHKTWYLVPAEHAVAAQEVVRGLGVEPEQLLHKSLMVDPRILQVRVWGVKGRKLTGA